MRHTFKTSLGLFTRDFMSLIDLAFAPAFARPIVRWPYLPESWPTVPWRLSFDRVPDTTVDWVAWIWEGAELGQCAWVHWDCGLRLFLMSDKRYLHQSDTKVRYANGVWHSC